MQRPYQRAKYPCAGSHRAAVEDQLDGLGLAGMGVVAAAQRGGIRFLRGIGVHG